MRKLLLALPLLAGASWAGTTYYSGVQTQPAYGKLLSQLNQLKPLHFVSEKYDAGFMQSTAVTKVLLEGADGDKALFRLKHVINHSPVGVDNAGTRVGANSVVTTLMLEKMNAEFTAALGGREPIVLHTRVDTSGSTANDLTLTEFTLADEDENVEFGGGHFNFVSEPSGRVHGKGSTKAITVNHTSGGVLKFAEAPLAVDMQYISQGLYSGSANWDSPSLEVTDPRTGMTISMKQLKFASDTKVSNDLLKSGVSFSVGQLEAPIPVTAFNWNFSVHGLPIEGLIKYEKTRSELMSSGASSDENSMEQIVDIYKSIIAPGTGAKSALYVSNQSGDMALDVNIDFNGDGSASGTDNMESVRDLLMAMTLSAKLDADAEAVEASPLGMFMGHPLATQYIINDGVKYSADLTFKDVILYANGETHDVIEMFGLAPMLDTPLDFLGSM